ncbi:13185_t:CDS:2, partial [Acaulospora morrowiae]
NNRNSSPITANQTGKEKIKEIKRLTELWDNINLNTGQKITFNTRCEYFPSSTKAELMAILIAIELIPTIAN